VLIASAICVFFSIHGLRLVKVQDVQTSIVQGLGPTSDKTAVHRFMDGHSILYTGYSQDLDRMYGKIYRTSFIGFMKGRILVQFDFDAQGRMASYMVVEVYDFVWE
jgi:hypothetical protein